MLWIAKRRKKIFPRTFLPLIPARKKRGMLSFVGKFHQTSCPSPSLYFVCTPRWWNSTLDTIDCTPYAYYRFRVAWCSVRMVTVTLRDIKIRCWHAISTIEPCQLRMKSRKLHLHVHSTRRRDTTDENPNRVAIRVRLLFRRAKINNKKKAPSPTNA